MNNEIWIVIANELSEGSLLELHGIISKRLEEEDAGKSSENYGVRKYSDWREQADIIEQTMLDQKIHFEPIKW